MKDWKVKLVQIHKRHAELEEPEAHWSKPQLDDQYIEQMAEL